ncbi:hypothetical protein FSARC_1036 [Fusarium sarcochroum]|uniref:Metalloprotease n=1 Tax=Fusarium sarcochroum TaxID=1208366 RepID=A0A8H4XFS3_9HYPO|nr:hypothetical protein FSARC_1036 [Fusarium sarcochroum]
MVAVPPHILRAIAQSKAPDHIRQSAMISLTHTESFLGRRACHRPRRQDQGQGQGQDQGQGQGQGQNQHRQIVPPHILRNVVESNKADETRRDQAKHSLNHLQDIIGKVRGSQQPIGASPKGSPYIAVHDIHTSPNESDLPRELIRDNGEKVKDKAVNEAYDNVGTVLGFYKKYFKWLSIDNKNMDVVSTVHFGKSYENAFWDPEKLQMVFGDGGEFLNNFTGCIDVIGHELTHAVTEHTSPLDYYGQAGALNEHISDVFGIMVKQKVQDEQSNVADWLIGEDCILPGVKGTALRSMKEPGTAYDDPVFGKDPQAAHMKQFKTMFEDNGGVHIFSGIPNRAFYLVSVSFDGYSWEKAGKIWWAALKSGKISPKCTFKQFANVTIDCAKELFDASASKKVKQAWADVGVIQAASSSSGSGTGCNVL